MGLQGGVESRQDQESGTDSKCYDTASGNPFTRVLLGKRERPSRLTHGCGLQLADAKHCGIKGIHPAKEGPELDGHAETAAAPISQVAGGRRRQ